MGDFTHLKNKKGELIAKPLPQPTLPNLSVDDDDFNDSSTYNRPSPSNHTKDTYYYSSESKADYPPMPAYNQPYSTHQPPGAYAYFNPSQITLGPDDPYQQPPYESDADSTTYLPATAPMSRQRSISPTSHAIAPSYVADPHEVYQGRARTLETPRRLSAYSDPRPSSFGLAYDDILDDYESPSSDVNPPADASAQWQESHRPESSNLPQDQQRPRSNEQGGQRGRTYGSAM
jgi:hypothetical protein